MAVSRKPKFDQDKAVKSIIGVQTFDETQNVFVAEETTSIPTIKKAEAAQTKLSPKTIYLTSIQKRALKIKVALSDKTQHKDESAVVRAAIESYLADIIKTL